MRLIFGDTAGTGDPIVLAIAGEGTTAAGPGTVLCYRPRVGVHLGGEPW